MIQIELEPGLILKAYSAASLIQVFFSPFVAFPFFVSSQTLKACPALMLDSNTIQSNKGNY